MPSTVASDVSFIQDDQNEEHYLDLDEEMGDLNFDEPTEEEVLRREQMTGRLSTQTHAPSFDETYEISSDDETINTNNNTNANNITPSNLTSNESFYFGDESTLNNANAGVNQIGLNFDEIGDLNESNESLNTTIETPHGMSLGSEHNINNSDSDDESESIGGSKKKTKKNKKKHNKRKLTKKRITLFMKGGVRLDPNYGVTNPFPEVNLHE
jgi:hypothetical protein